MSTIQYDRVYWENYPSTTTPLNADNLNHMDAGIADLTIATAGLQDGFDGIDARVSEAEQKVVEQYGSPLVATTVSDMTDTTRVYVYIGSETGYVSGDWYYWDGSAWADGGVYNAIAIETDKTLTVEDMAADAKATGEKIEVEVKANLLETALVSGNPIIIRDGADNIPVKDLKVTIAPKQDLHGYDNPWPAGGGKNLINIDTVTLSSAGNWASNKELDKPIPAGTYTFSVTTSAQSAWTVGLKDENGDSVGSGASATNTPGRQSVVVALTGTATMISGYLNAPATMSDFQLESGSSATSYAPYSNLCPITGMDRVEVKRTGKNLFAFGNQSPTTHVDLEFSEPLPAGTYTISAKVTTTSTGNQVDARFRKQDGSALEKVTIDANTGARESATFTISEPAYYVYLYASKGNTSYVCTWEDIQLEESPFATSYEPYKEQTLDIDLPDGVYGCTIDVTSGTLTVDRVMATKLFSELTVVSTDTPNSRYSVSKVFGDNVTVETEAIGANGSKRCNIAKYAWRNDTSDVHFYMSNTGSVNIVLPNDTASSQEIQFCAKLATPLTYQLTPQEMTTLLGYNYITSNGEMNLVYRKNKRAYAYIDELSSVYPTEEAQGNPATFTDGAEEVPVKDLKVEIVPQQDLHGYENPWPAAGGKNKWEPFSDSVNGITFTVQADGTVLITGTATATSWATVSEPYLPLPYNGIDVGNSVVFWSNTYAEIRFYDSNKTLISSHNSYNNTPTTVVVPSGSSYISLYQSAQYGTVTSGTTLNLTGKFYIGIGASFDSWTPYSNLCPITGMDRVEVKRTGKNIFTCYEKTITAAGLTSVFNGHSVSISGTCTVDTALNLTFGTNPAPGAILQNGEIYTWSVKTEGTIPDTLSIYGGYHGTSVAQTSEFHPAGYGSKTIPSEGTYQDRVWIAVHAGEVYNGTLYIQTEKGSEKTPYAPYTAQTLDIDLGQTVYGAEISTLKGEMVIGKGKVTLNGSESWSKSSSYEGSYYLSNWASNHSITRSTDHIQSNLKTATSISEYTAYSCYFDYSLNIRVDSALVTSVEEFKAWLAENPVDLVYPLKEPITVHLTPQELTTILGVNNITTDAESVDVEYRADIKLYIENLTKPEEDDLIANNAIEAGTFFMIGNRLFLSTASIANGATITVGTNATELSLAEALNLLGVIYPSLNS